MLTYEIRLPKKSDVKAFAKFMREEYFPAVHKGPTRIGQVTELVLLRGEGTETAHTFLWLVGWSGLTNNPKSGPNVSDEAVLGRFKSFGARVKVRRVWDEVAAWHNREA